MSEQNTTYTRTEIQNRILDLEKKYMEILNGIFTSDRFIADLKKIEADTQEYYDLLGDIWGKKNKIKEASERLVRHHMYTSFDNVENFYPFPISCDIALETEDIILNVDVKTIDKIGNSNELTTTQFEHNQTSFINDPVLATGSFNGFMVKSNLQTFDPRTSKPVLTYLIKIGYSDDGHGTFRLINETSKPSLVLTCLPNGVLSDLFDRDLFSNFKDYIYYDVHDGEYYRPRYITSKDEFLSLTTNTKFTKMESVTDIPENWERISYSNGKVGYFDLENKILWYAIQKKKQNHWDIYLTAVKNGNTARFNDEWLEKRYDSSNQRWFGEIKHFKIYG